MRTILLEELRNKCNEISLIGNDTPMVSKTIETYERILKFADTARKEGLLELEEIATRLDMNDDTQSFFFKIITLVVDGTEPTNVLKIAANRYVTMNPQGFQGLMYLMYIEGGLMIQAGENLFIIKEMLKSMLPKVVTDELFRRECENALPDALAEAEQEQDMVDKLCKDDKEIDEQDHSVVSETAKTLIVLSDTDIQRLLRDVDNSSLTVAMKGLPGKARARIFNNMSERLAVMLANNMAYMGPVRFKDVEEECVKLMKSLLKLAEFSEIREYDFSILKVVIDMFDSADNEKQKLKEKYKEIRSIINKIYND